MSRSQVQQEYGTAAECNAATLTAREAVIDTTNWCWVIFDGVNPGGYRQASRAWVATQIAALQSGMVQSLVLWAGCR